MKKVFFAFCVMALAFCMTACEGPKPDPINPDDIVEDGVYVTGEATGFDKVSDVLRMAGGINEAKDQSARDGMFEKYIVLQGGKEFSLIWVNGGQKNYYGATLEEFTPTDFSGIYQDNPGTPIQKGALVVGESAPKMKVAKTGLYHIVLDLNKANDLDNAQILVAPANWGVRGGMNGWSFTEMTATAASNDGMTFTIENAELVNGLEFKFAYGGAWKITLDNAGEVKANTNLGQNSKPGGDNFVVETPGLYNISLTFKLAAGEIANSFSYKIELGEEIEITAPEHMYMIGAQWGNWAWDSDGIVELAGIPSAPGYFWCTRYFEAANGFKFCALKEWSGDFTGDGTVGYTVNDGNCWVAEDGFYTVFVNGNDKVVEIYPAEVYGIGSAWGGDAWDFNAPDIVKFQPDGRTLVATVTNTDGAVRLSSKIVPSAPIDGITTPNGWIDWWKTEFVYFDGKIAYRGAGGDQERVAVEAGQQITIDFNAGTVTVGEAFAGAITIDGNMAEWAAIEDKVVSAKETPVYAEFKVTNDSKFIYFYSKRDNRDAIWNRGGYIYYDIDADNNPETGVAKEITGLEMWLYFFPFADKAIATDVGGADAYPSKAVFNNFKFAGAIADDFVEIEAALPLSDAGVKSGDEIAVYSWSNKSGDDLKKTPIIYTVK